MLKGRSNTEKARKLRKQLLSLGVSLPEAIDKEQVPQTEEKIISVLNAVALARQALGQTNQQIEQYAGLLEKRLEQIRTGAGQSILRVHQVWPAPPHLLGQFSDPVGDMNLLLDVIPFTNPVISKLLRRLVFELIEKTGGFLPDVFGVFDFVVNDHTEPRLVVKWVIHQPPQLQNLRGVYEITKQSYGQEVRGRKKNERGWESVIQYLDSQDNLVPKRHGLYFGPNPRYTSGARGVMVTRQFERESEFRYLKESYPNDWLTRSIESKPIKQFEVEVREGGQAEEGVAKNPLNQADLLSLVVQLGYFFKHGGVIDQRSLAIEIFRDLNRVGAEGAAQARLFGLHSVLEIVERVLLLPLQQPTLAQAYRFPPESILLAGVPGVGKTLLAKFLMSQQYNAIFVSVDSAKLLLDLTDEKGSKILLQIDRVGNATQLPVVLLVDDIDTVTSDKERDSAVISKLLNLFQGVREKGFFIIASTNHPERIDPRLLEPGRLSKIVHVPLPDYEDRVGILGLYLEDVPFNSEKEKVAVIKKMAEETTGWTGRYLRALVHEAGRVRSLLITGRDISGYVPVESVDLPSLELADFLRAKKLILSGVDTNKFRKEDEQIRRFVSQRGGVIGFHSNNRK